MSSQLHNFSDTSGEGYGAVLYLRVVNEARDVHCAFFYGEVAEANTPEVGYYSSSGAFSQDYATWVGCTTVWRVLLDRQQMCVLSYIANKEKSSIITTMHEESRPYQWNHVATGFNPADALKSSSTKSAGLMALPYGGKQRTAGLRNLKFLCDKEVSTVEADFLTRMVQSCSSQYRLKKLMAWTIRYRSNLLCECCRRKEGTA